MFKEKGKNEKGKIASRGLFPSGFLLPSYRAFTLIELVVSIAIFAFMTTLLVAKYGNFNQSILLTNLAYDVALTLRTAQTYGLSVKNINVGGTFQYAYGVDFSTASAGSANKTLTLFGTPSTGTYKDDFYSGSGVREDIEVSKYSVKRGAFISSLCAGADEADCVGHTANVLDITFKRPDPNAIMCVNTSGGMNCNPTYKFAKVIVQASDGSTRDIKIRSNGQISVGD